MALKTDAVEPSTPEQKDGHNEVEELNRMLGAVMEYLSNDQIEEIDIEYLLNNTEGLRDWWKTYREKNRQEIEKEIQKSISELPLEELENLREMIKDKIK